MFELSAHPSLTSIGPNPIRVLVSDKKIQMGNRWELLCRIREASFLKNKTKPNIHTYYRVKAALLTIPVSHTLRITVCRIQLFHKQLSSRVCLYVSFGCELRKAMVLVMGSSLNVTPSGRVGGLWPTDSLRGGNSCYYDLAFELMYTSRKFGI